MLLYVDKKKIKRRKIKIISSVTASVLILIANIICFNNSLHHTKQHLSTYTPLQKTHLWYENADIVQLFSKKEQSLPYAILIPKKITSENLITIASAFSKLENTPTNFFFTKEVSELPYLLQLAQLYTTTSLTAPHSVVISTEPKELLPVITHNQLIPTALNYQQALKKPISPKLQQLINKRFPPIQLPENKQETEQLALANFIKDYETQLKTLIFTPKKSTDFASKSLLLQNTGICLTTQNSHLCQTDSQTSLQQNLQTALAQFPDKTVLKKLILLTSQEEIALNAPLATDDGIAFQYEERYALLLPEEKNNSTNYYTLLKQQTGINPDYHTEDMKFYKFKTMEITLNDKI